MTQPVDGASGRGSVRPAGEEHTITWSWMKGWGRLEVFDIGVCGLARPSDSTSSCGAEAVGGPVLSSQLSA